jgi:hypothetical protein
MLGNSATSSSGNKPQFKPLNNTEALGSDGANSQISEQVLKENTDTWTSWLTGPNISISRAADTQPSQTIAPKIDEQLIIEQALAVIQKAQGVTPEQIKRDEPIEHEAIVFDESSKEKIGNEIMFYSHGEIIFNSTSESIVEKKIEEDESKAPTTMSTEKIEESFKRSKNSEKSSEGIFSSSKNMLKELYEPFQKVFGGVFSFFKGLFGGLKDVIKENSKRPLTAEEQKAKAEKEKKDKEKSANKKIFYDKLNEGIVKFNEARRNERMENKQRLGIMDLDVASANKLLSGENQALRNLSNKEIDYLYHDEQTAVAMILKRKADQEKEAKKHSFKSQGKKAMRGPSLEMSMEKQHGSDNAMTKVLG